MKQMILITGVILLSCVIMTSVVIPANARQSAVNETTQSTEAALDNNNTYVLKSSDGVLAVYIKGVTEPALVTDTYVSVLPKDDQKKLKEGIEVQGEQELKRALEDYCS